MSEREAFDRVQVAAPAFTLNAHEHERHQSNNRFISPRSAFITMPSEMGGALGPDITRMPGSVAGWMSAMSDVEITRQREDSCRRVLQAERRRAGQSLALVGIVIFLDVLLFVPHWLLAARVRSTTPLP